MSPFIIILVALGVFIYVAEGVLINPFAVWNALPLFVSYALYKSGKSAGKRARVWGAVGFLAGSMALSGYVHLAWMFDWGEIKTGSSTAGLIFIFIPIYAVIAGGIGYLSGWAIGRVPAGKQT